MHRVCNEYAEQYVLECAAVRGGTSDPISDSKCRGRGFGASVQRVKVSKAATTSSGLLPDEDRMHGETLLIKLKVVKAKLLRGNELEALQGWRHLAHLGSSSFNCPQSAPFWRNDATIPDGDVLTHIIETVNVAVIEQYSKSRARVIQRYIDSRMKRIEASPGHLFREFREAAQAPLAVIKRREEWLPIFSKHTGNGVPPPCRDWCLAFCCDLVKHLFDSQGRRGGNAETAAYLGNTAFLSYMGWYSWVA